MAKKLVFHHFAHHTFGAPGEPVRLALVVGKLDFEDHRIPRLPPDEWGELKYTDAYPFHQLPVLEVDGVPISQSNAILRYVGLLTGLYPTECQLKAAKCDQVMGTIMDIKAKLGPSIMMKDVETKGRMRQLLASQTLPWWFERLEQQLKRNDEMFGGPQNGFSVGHTLTVADLALDVFLGWFDAGCFIGIQPDILDFYPRLRSVREVVASVPPIFKWRQANQPIFVVESDWDLSVQGLRSSSALPAVG